MSAGEGQGRIGVQTIFSGAMDTIGAVTNVTVSKKYPPHCCSGYCITTYILTQTAAMEWLIFRISAFRKSLAPASVFLDTALRSGIFTGGSG